MFSELWIVSIVRDTEGLWGWSAYDQRGHLLHNEMSLAAFPDAVEAVLAWCQDDAPCLTERAQAAPLPRRRRRR